MEQLQPCFGKTRVFSYSFHILMFFVLNSCTPIIMMVSGIKNPSPKTNEEIKAKALDCQIAPENTFFIHEDYLFTQYTRGANETQFFDKNGVAVNLDLAGEDPRCHNNVLGLIKGLGKVTYAVRDSALRLEEIIRNAIHIDQYTQPKLDSDADYYFVQFWNTFSGKARNEKHIALIRKTIQENPRVKIQLILINNDLRTGVDWEQKAKDFKAAQTSKTN